MQSGAGHQRVSGSISKARLNENTSYLLIKSGQCAIKEYTSAGQSSSLHSGHVNCTLLSIISTCKYCKQLKSSKINHNLAHYFYSSADEGKVIQNDILTTGSITVNSLTAVFIHLRLFLA